MIPPRREPCQDAWHASSWPCLLSGCLLVPCRPAVTFCEMAEFLPRKGDLVLRAGTYLNSKDARFSLHGVYVVDSSSLHAVAEPEEPMSAALRPSELHQHTPDYRCGPACVRFLYGCAHGIRANRDSLAPSLRRLVKCAAAAQQVYA